MYGSVADCKTYHLDRGRDISATYSDSQISAALLISSEWIDGRYGPSFVGYKTGGFTQEREWPRTNAYTNTFPEYIFATTDIPDRVVTASYEAAFRELEESGSLNVDFSASEFKSVRVEGSIDVTYNSTVQLSDVQKQIQIVDQLLSPLLDLNSGAKTSGLSGGVIRS